MLRSLWPAGVNSSPLASRNFWISASMRLRTSSLLSDGFLLWSHHRGDGESLEFGKIDGLIEFDLDFLCKRTSDGEQAEYEQFHISRIYHRRRKPRYKSARRGRPVWSFAGGGALNCCTGNCTVSVLIGRGGRRYDRISEAISGFVAYRDGDDCRG